jgi:ubiquinone/menaquinone biosynthesis C-methylase UbiE
VQGWSKATAGAALLLAIGLAPACGEAADGAPPAKRGMTAEDYDAWRRPDVLVAALELRAGDVVADVGAGRGYLTGRLARAVGPTGRVVATDIDARLLAEVDRLPSMTAAAPIETRLVSAEHPGLEPGGYDLVLLAEVDHYLADRVGYLRRLRGALSGRGRIAVSNRLHHRERLLAAALDAGYVVKREHRTELPGQYLVLLAPASREP